MHPELLSLCLFMFVTSCSPGPNNIVASHSGFNHGFKKTIPLMLGVIFLNRISALLSIFVKSSKKIQKNLLNLPKTDYTMIKGTQFRQKK